MRYKNVFLTAFSFLLLTGSLSAQFFEWSKRAGSYAFDLGYGICTDNAGNVYVTGKYEYNANFSGTYVSCVGNHDIFIAKYNSSGSLQWVKTAGGVGGDYAHAICSDASGNVYITGEIEQTVNFGAVSIKGYGDHNDVFIAKYNSSGVLQWAKLAGGGYESDQGFDISADASGNIYLTGQFTGTAYFDSKTLVSSGVEDVFVAKYNTNGDFQWIKQAGGTGTDEGLGITADSAGNCYVTGDFRGVAKFESTVLTSSGEADIFIAKYNTNGTLQWVKKAGGILSDYGRAIAVSKSGDVFVTGGCRVHPIFGVLSLYISGGDAGVFTACYDTYGNVKWVKKADGILNDHGRGIAVDKHSNVYICGSFGDAAMFDTVKLVSADSSDIFIASYTAAGNFRWVLKADGVPDELDNGRFPESALSVAVDTSGNVYTTGNYRTDAIFGYTTLINYNNNHTDIFVTKITQSIIPPPAPIALTATITASGALTFCEGGNVTLYANTGQDYIYQWRRNSADISGATNSSYIVTTSGDYQIKITQESNTVWSAPKTVTVNNCNTIPLKATITASGSTTFCTGDSVILNATIGQGYVYQWKKNGSAIPGATNSSYTVKESGDYQVKITSGSNIDWSAPQTVTVNNCNTIPFKATITASGSTTFCTGDSVILNATIGQGYVYQWKKDGSAIPGATNSSYTVKESGDYQVKITSGSNIDWSTPIAVTVYNCNTPLVATITVLGSTTFCIGDSVILYANTGPGYIFQWKKNGSAIPGANESFFVVTSSGDYQVKIIQGASIAWSAPKKVVVNNCSSPSATLTATITVSGPTTLCTGDSVILYANTGQGYIYQWKKNGGAIPGANDSIYVATTGGDYQIKITQGTNSAWSAPMRVIVNNCKMSTLFPQQLPEDSVLNLPNPNNSFQLKVYPNPTSGLFTLDIAFDNLMEKRLIIEVVNILGERVYHREPLIANGFIRETIELNNSLPEGIYVLKVTVGDKTENTGLMLVK